MSDLNPETAKKLADDVLAILVSERGRDSISHVVSELRDRGWRRLDSIRLEKTLRGLGFDVEYVYRGEFVVRTYVSVGK